MFCSRYGKVDLLINCAGMLHPSGRGETSLKSVSQEVILLAFQIKNSINVFYVHNSFAYMQEILLILPCYVHVYLYLSQQTTEITTLLSKKL